MVFWSAQQGMNRVVAVSENVRQSFAKQAGISLSKIDTIYNGIELNKFKRCQPRNELRNRFGWGLENPIAVLVSVLRPGKGIEVLFDALPRIRAILPKFQLKLVGAGELERDLREKSITDAPFAVGHIARESTPVTIVTREICEAAV